MIVPLAVAAVAFMLLSGKGAPAQVAPAVQPLKTKMHPFEAATALKAYLLGGGKFGVKGAPSKQVMIAQRVFGIPADGIVGPVTRKAAAKHGVTLPLRKSR